MKFIISTIREQETLKTIGEDPGSQDFDMIAKAEDVLVAVRPHIQKFHSSEYINALANGDIFRSWCYRFMLRWKRWATACLKRRKTRTQAF